MMSERLEEIKERGANAAAHGDQVVVQRLRRDAWVSLADNANKAGESVADEFEALYQERDAAQAKKLQWKEIVIERGEEIERLKTDARATAAIIHCLRQERDATNAENYRLAALIETVATEAEELRQERDNLKVLLSRATLIAASMSARVQRI